MKKIVWHIGFRKTGTTSVQYLLARLPMDQLADHFISSRDHLTKPWREHIIRATRRRTRPDPIALRFEMAKLAATLRDVPQQTIIISDENLFAFSLYARDGGHFFQWAAEVLPLIEDEFAEFENVFIAYTRPWEKWLKSTYSQEVKRGRTARGYDSWCKRVPKDCNWTDGIATIRAAIRSPLILLEQAEDAERGQPLGTRLIELAGIPKALVEAVGPVPRLNESLSPRAMLVFRFFNALGLNGILRGIVQPRLRARELQRQ